MAKCCICGGSIADLRNAALLSEIDSDNNLMCNTCEDMLIGSSMDDSPEAIRKSFDYFAKCMKNNEDEKVRDYLEELLLTLKKAFRYVPEETEEEEILSLDSDDEDEETDYGSGTWLNILYACAWINVIVGIAVSVILGILVGEAVDSTFGGITAAVAGLVITFASSALVMVVLNAAKDIRLTRMYTKDIRDRK